MVLRITIPFYAKLLVLFAIIVLFYIVICLWDLQRPGRGLSPTSSGLRARATFLGKSAAESGRALKKSPLPASPLDVVVTEEHHEALPYWAEIQPTLSGALLVHVDAHPDDAVPYVIPSTAQTVVGSRNTEASSPAAYVSIVNNDEFIVQACLMGYLAAIVWIYPHWDNSGPRHGDEKAKDRVATYRAGQALDGGTCLCESAKVEFDFEDVSGSLARSRESRFACADSDDNSIRQSRCDVLSTCSFISVSEDSIMSLEGASLSGWSRFLNSYAQAVLDIDEDFFARVTSQDRVALALGSWKNAKVEQDIASLCPTREQGVEAKANAAFVETIRLLQDCSSESADHNCERQASEPLAPFQCSGENGRVPGSHALVSQLSTLPRNQLEVLASAGVCLTTSPATDRSQRFKLRICSEGRQGKNRVDTVRSKSEEVLSENAVAVARRLDKFSEWGSSKVLNQRNFDMVTICRSVRDGYTPRRVWESIEHSVIQTLGGQARFDQHLMGGRLGRPL